MVLLISEITFLIFVFSSELAWKNISIIMLFKIIPHGLKIKKSVSAKNKFGHALLFNYF